MDLQSSRNASVTFWGAAQSVTGSMHLVQASGRKLMLDCGAVKGPHAEVHLPGRAFPFGPQDFDAVVLSHAHIDHCGNLPLLVRHGFSGPIYCTPATRDLIALMLADSVRFLEYDAHVWSVVQSSASSPSRTPYTHAHVEQVIRQCVTVPYGQTREIIPGVSLLLVDAGHILGSAIVSLTISTDAGPKVLTFTGDLGRRGSPLLHDTGPIPASDVLICESTHGGKRVPSLIDTAASFEALVRVTLERGGKVLVPAFSLGRTQLLVHYVQEAMLRGRVPQAPIYVDSALASDITEVYRQHFDSLNEACIAHLRSARPTPVETEEGSTEDTPDETLDFMEGGRVQYVRSIEDSRELNNLREPCVIVAPSGMCDGGRIVSHIKHHIDDPRCSLAMVCYQAPHTLGHRLMLPGPTIRIHGHSCNRWADVVAFPGFSAHPDEEEILFYLEPLDRQTRIRLVHGELENARTLARHLRGRGFTDVSAPGRGETEYLH